MARPSRYPRALAAAIAVVFAVLFFGVSGGELIGQRPAVAIDADDIGGVVTGPKGPEAGVWVIAETTNLPTKFIRSVVTDDQGRYLVPDLPKGMYNVWVRGYGLVDSAKVQSEPGKIVNLTSVPAPSAQAAAEYYPAQYLVLAASTASRERVSRHRPIGQRNLDRDPESGRMDRRGRWHRRVRVLSWPRW